MKTFKVSKAKANQRSRPLKDRDITAPCRRELVREQAFMRQELVPLIKDACAGGLQVLKVDVRQGHPRFGPDAISPARLLQPKTWLRSIRGRLVAAGARRAAGYAKMRLVRALSPHEVGVCIDFTLLLMIDAGSRDEVEQVLRSTSSGQRSRRRWPRGQAKIVEIEGEIGAVTTAVNETWPINADLFVPERMLYTLPDQKHLDDISRRMRTSLQLTFTDFNPAHMTSFMGMSRNGEHVVVH